MRTVSHQGSQLSASERRTMAMRASVRAALSSVDPEQPRTDLTQQFVGPATPRHVLISRVPEDWETTRYWKLVADFKRYGQCEYQAKGTPWLGEVLGDTPF